MIDRAINEAWRYGIIIHAPGSIPPGNQRWFARWDDKNGNPQGISLWKDNPTPADITKWIYDLVNQQLEMYDFSN